MRDLEGAADLLWETPSVMARFEEVKRFDFCHGLIGHVIQKCQFFYCRWCSPWLGAAKCGGLVALNRWGAEVHSAGFCELTRRWDRLETLDTIHRL